VTIVGQVDQAGNVVQGVSKGHARSFVMTDPKFRQNGLIIPGNSLLYMYVCSTFESNNNTFEGNIIYDITFVL